ncbi:MAG: DUF2165 domain-containing protein [Desulfobacteraceae bacterium]|nr:DUF2165 domain-containing protein [Desulfobacteraceae bacterium]
MFFRFFITGLVWSIALYSFVVVLNNIFDSGLNYDIVHHVMKMNTMFSGDNFKWRSIGHAFFLHAAYVLLFFFKAVTAV